MTIFGEGRIGIVLLGGRVDDEGLELAMRLVRKEGSGELGKGFCAESVVDARCVGISR